jgi:hypothetical protein
MKGGLVKGYIPKGSLGRISGMGTPDMAQMPDFFKRSPLALQVV